MVVCRARFVGIEFVPVLPIFSKRALVPYSAEQMFALVADVPSYPEFVPWCVAAQAHPVGAHSVEATLHIGKGAISTRFTTRNDLHPGERIELRLVKGPFKHLRGMWCFEDVGERRSRVSLELEFEMSNRLLKRTVGRVFEELARRLVDAFTQRAKHTYGDS